MAVIWEELITFSATATCNVPGSIVVATDDALFSANAYLDPWWKYEQKDYSWHVPLGAFGSNGQMNWTFTDIPGGLRLIVTAELYSWAEAGDFTTVSVAYTWYGIRLSDDEAFGLLTPVLERRIT